MLNVFAGLKLLVPFAFACMSLCIIFILYKQIQYKKQLEETNHKLNILFDLVRSETEKRHLDQSIQYQVREGGSGSGSGGGGGTGIKMYVNDIVGEEGDGAGNENNHTNGMEDDDKRILVSDTDDFVNNQNVVIRGNDEESCDDSDDYDDDDITDTDTSSCVSDTTCEDIDEEDKEEEETDVDDNEEEEQHTNQPEDNANITLKHIHYDVNHSIVNEFLNEIQRAKENTQQEEIKSVSINLDIDVDLENVQGGVRPFDLGTILRKQHTHDIEEENKDDDDENTQEHCEVNEDDVLSIIDDDLDDESSVSQVSDNNSECLSITYNKVHTTQSPEKVKDAVVAVEDYVDVDVEDKVEKQDNDKDNEDNHEQENGNERQPNQDEKTDYKKMKVNELRDLVKQYKLHENPKELKKTEMITLLEQKQD